MLLGVFTDFLSSAEDINLQYQFTNLLKLIRFFALIITLTLPGFYIAITTFHQEIIPTELLFAIVSSRSAVPFPIIFEIILIDLSLELIRESVSGIKGLNNVEVDSFDGLTIDYARKVGAKFLIRGLRAVSDFEYEMQLSQTNQAIAPEIGTVFLITKPKYNFISSGIVKELSFLGQDVSKFVPKSVVEYLEKKKINSWE